MRGVGAYVHFPLDRGAIDSLEQSACCTGAVDITAVKRPLVSRRLAQLGVELELDDEAHEVPGGGGFVTGENQEE